MGKNVLIIGSGLGGLTTALRLAKAGYSVKIVEKHSSPGGRLNQLKKDGFTFDMAPTFFSMTYEFTTFGKDTGIRLPFEFYPLNPLYTVRIFDPKSGKDRKYTIYKEFDKLAKEFASIEPDFDQKVKRYLRDTGRLFDDTIDRVVRRNFYDAISFGTSLAGVPPRQAPKMVRTFWQEISRYFESDDVKMIFSLVSFFLGATPFNTMAVYTLLNYVEMEHDGYYNVKGGMYKIVEGLMNEIEKAGIEVTYNTEIIGKVTEGNTLQGFIDTSGRLWEADLFVANADAAAFRGQVLQRQKFSPGKLDKMQWTMAPLTLYLGVKGKIEGLDHHNYFLGDNFKDYSSKVFSNDVSLKQPYYYVNVTSRHNPEAAPEGHENLFILVPVPDLRFKPDWSDAEEIADNVIQDLSQRVGFDIPKNMVSRTVLAPPQWEKMLNLYRGSGLGLGHSLRQIGYWRPKNKDEKYNNLFYVGSSTVPGTGLPMAVISSKLCAERILHDYGSVSE
ncbi:MAG: phytoene desaturase family protein [Bacteroidales bacterium]|nr:phytoene desaturase family protein [Bacteroidales bacterium]MDY0286385.1 phytoene desaturase family protein [Bacteroidales bacterium]